MQHFGVECLNSKTTIRKSIAPMAADNDRLAHFEVMPLQIRDWCFLRLVGSIKAYKFKVSDLV